MTSVYAYYDGQNYIMDERIPVRENQRVLITFLDEAVPVNRKRSLSEIKSYMDARSRSVPQGVSTVDYIRELREE